MATQPTTDAHALLRQLEALDVAVRGIASVQSVDRVLQVIVDRVRELVGARYAALGIVGSFGRIDQFIVSGITPEQRALLGAPPRGHGLLGTIIKEDRALLVDDIATDPRRYGFPEHHPEMHSLLGVPVRSRGETIGNLYLTNKETAPTFDAADLQLVERFALHAGIAIENARLHEELGRLAILDERQRISQDLHDSIIQSLYGISLSLEDLPEVIIEDPAEGAARADRAIDGIHATIRDIRNFIMGLQPELLADADLRAGLETLAAEFRANTLIDLELKIDPDLPRLPDNHAAHLLAMTREALSNIAKHSNATRASIELSARRDLMTLTVVDNGRGFDIGAERSARQHGLANLRARAEAVGGTLELTSAQGAGTRIVATIPITEVSTDDN
jgi:signal transduction histidine kinase